MALSTELIAARKRLGQSGIAVARRDRHFECWVVWGAVCAVTTRACDALLRETPGLHQGLWAVKTVRPPVRPEVSLRILRRHGLADQKRHCEILVAVTRAESGEEIHL